MRKIILLTFLLLSFSLIAKEEISLDEIFIKIESEKDSYESKKYLTQEEKIENLIKENKLGDFNGIEFSSNFYANENSYEGRLRKYGKFLQNKVSYGPFFLNYNYTENKNTYISYGVEKNIKNLFYSSYTSNMIINQLNKKLNKIEYLKNVEDKKIEFLNLFQNILDTQNELIYRKEAKKYYENEVKKIQKQYNLGMEAKISLEASEVELEDLLLKIEILEKKLNSFYEIARNDYNLDLENYSLKEIIYPKDDTDENINKYLNLDLENIQINIKILEERAKYSKYEDFMPDLLLAYERIDKTERTGRTYRDENVFSIKFSKKLFSNNTETKNLNLDKQKLIDDLNEKKKELVSERLKLSAENDDLKKTAQIAEKKLNISKKRYEIKKKEYELNRASYLDVIDDYNKYLAQEIENKRAKNNYNAFMYRVAIRADYEVDNEEIKR